jgi:zinc protease
MFETTPEAAASIGQLFVHNLPLNYYHELPDEIERISASDVHRAARAYLMPENAVIVAVGNRDRIQPELEKLGLPIEVRDSAGNPIEVTR